MPKLLRIEWRVTRWAQAAALACGLGVAAVLVLERGSGALMMLFVNMVYGNLIYTQCRLALTRRPDNLLLNSLPVTRARIVLGKYAYVLLCAAAYPAYLCLLCTLVSHLGVTQEIPVFTLWLTMAAMGVLYQLLLLPLSYLDARYGTWASTLLYFAVMLLPARLGKGNAAPAVQAWLARLTAHVNAWSAPLLVAALLAALGALSFAISRRLYRRAEF